MAELRGRDSLSARALELTDPLCALAPANHRATGARSILAKTGSFRPRG